MADSLEKKNEKVEEEYDDEDEEEEMDVYNDINNSEKPAQTPFKEKTTENDNKSVASSKLKLGSVLGSKSRRDVSTTESKVAKP